MPVLGNFLELSVHTPDIKQSVEFYETLGFRHASVGEIWTHLYAVLTDGRLFIGLHQYEFASPSLTYVRPDLATHVRLLDERGVQFEFRKLGEDDFHEAGFLDPSKLMITLLEPLQEDSYHS